MKILFDATILAEGLHKTSNRSGIFWASYGIFGALAAREDVEMGIYASPSAVDSVNRFMDECFSGRGYRVVNRKRSCFLGPLRELIEDLREIPANKRGWRKIVLQGMGMAVKIARVLWDKYMLRRSEARIADGFDLFFSPVYLAPRAIRKYSGIPRVTLLYDTIPMLYPQFSPFTMLGFSWNFDLIKGLSETDYCFAISECTKRDFMRFNPRLKDDHISVLPLAADEKFYHETDASKRMAVRKKYGIPLDKRYVLSLCTIEPRKNLGFALEAFGKFVENSHADDVVFVLAGGQWGRFEGKWSATLAKLSHLKDKIVHAGYIDDEDLAALYSDALMFIYPSLYEGFGLPPLEAMQCGCPVITSNVSSLPEVVGDAAVAIAPDDLDAAAAAMSKIYSDESFRSQLADGGMERAREFSWAKTAEKIVRGFDTISAGKSEK
jgi:glycosyltransferase involved in cell wall biosynthesis